MNMQGLQNFMQPHLDGIQNLLTGQGVGRSDPTLYSNINGRVLLQQNDQSNLYQYGLIQKIVCKLPQSATSKWGLPTITAGEQQQVNAIAKALDDLLVVMPGELPTTGAKNAFHLALWKAFFTGNGAIVIHTDDRKEATLADPIDLKSLKSIKRLVVLDRWEITPSIERKGDFQEITHFQTMGGLIHASRVLWFTGERLDRLTRDRNQGCDASILDGIHECFKQYVGGIAGAARMLHDFDVVDIGVKDLWELSKEKSALLYQRSQQNVMMRSLYRAQIRDMDNESISNQTRTVGGYSDLLTMLKDWLLANTPYPPAVLFGEFSSGLTSSGKSQEERALWNDTIADLQESRLTNLMTGRNPTAPGLLEILCACTDGPTKGKKPEGLGWKWNPLFTPTPTEQAELEMSRAQIMATIGSLDPGFIPNAIVSNYGGSEFSPTINLSPEYLQATQDAASGLRPEELPVEEDGVPAEEEQPIEDSVNDDFIDKQVRESVMRGLKLLKARRSTQNPELESFVKTGVITMGLLNEWRSYWKKPGTDEESRSLHGGKYGKQWTNQPQRHI